MKAQSAEYERRSEPVPDMISQRLGQYEEALSRLGVQLENQEKQIADTREDFLQRSDRFRELKGLPPAPPPTEEPLDDNSAGPEVTSTESVIE